MLVWGRRGLAGRGIGGVVGVGSGDSGGVGGRSRGAEKRFTGLLPSGSGQGGPSH